MPIDYILHEPTLQQRHKIFSNMWWSLLHTISLILIWQSQPHHQWVGEYNMNHTYIDAIFGVRGYSCWNWQVFFCMQVNWGLQIMHRILKLVVLPSDIVLNPFADEEQLKPWTKLVASQKLQKSCSSGKYLLPPLIFLYGLPVTPWREFLRKV